MSPRSARRAACALLDMYQHTGEQLGARPPCSLSTAIRPTGGHEPLAGSHLPQRWRPQGCRGRPGGSGRCAPRLSGVVLGCRRWVARGFLTTARDAVQRLLPGLLHVDVRCRVEPAGPARPQRRRRRLYRDSSWERGSGCRARAEAPDRLDGRRPNRRSSRVYVLSAHRGGIVVSRWKVMRSATADTTVGVVIPAA